MVEIQKIYQRQNYGAGYQEKSWKKIKIMKTLRTTKDGKNYCKVKILNFEFQY